MRSRVLFTFLTLFALVLLIAAALLTRALLGLSVPDARPTPVVHYRKPRVARPAVYESVIEVTPQKRVTAKRGTGVADVKKGARPDTGAGGRAALPTMCGNYGPEITSRRCYPNPVGYMANFKRDGVVFTLFENDAIHTPHTPSTMQ